MLLLHLNLIIKMTNLILEYQGIIFFFNYLRTNRSGKENKSIINIRKHHESFIYYSLTQITLNFCLTTWCDWFCELYIDTPGSNEKNHWKNLIFFLQIFNHIISKIWSTIIVIKITIFCKDPKIDFVFQLPK